MTMDTKEPATMSTAKKSSATSTKEKKAATFMEKYLEHANQVLDSHSHRLVPNWILKRCKGVAIISTTELGVGISGGAGDGVIIKHNEDGSWGAPAAISVDVVGLGAILGVARKQILLYPMNDACLKDITETNYKLGAQVGIAAGPIGREAEVGAETSGLELTYSYVFEKGAFVSAGINGTLITQQKKANEEFYGSDICPTEIVMEPGVVSIPEGKGVEELHQKLADMTA